MAENTRHGASCKNTDDGNSAGQEEKVKFPCPSLLERLFGIVVLDPDGLDCERFDDDKLLDLLVNGTLGTTYALSPQRVIASKRNA